MYPQTPNNPGTGGSAGPYGPPQPRQPYPQPQYPQPQYPQPQYPQPQYPQPQYPQQFGQPGPYPPLPPRRSKAGLAVGVVVLAALAVGGVTLGVLQPWKSAAESGPHQETATLDHGISVTVEVPAGWKMLTGAVGDEQAMMLVPEHESRTMTQINDDGNTINDGGTGEQIHAVLAESGTCPSSTTVSIGEWSRDADTDADNGQTRRTYGTTRVDSSYCVRVVGVDFAHSTDDLESDASDLATELFDDDAITAARAA